MEENNYYVDVNQSTDNWEITDGPFVENNQTDLEIDNSMVSDIPVTSTQEDASYIDEMAQVDTYQDNFEEVQPDLNDQQLYVNYETPNEEFNDIAQELPADDLTGYMDINSNEEVYQDIPATETVDPSLTLAPEPIEGQYEEVSTEAPLEDYQDVPIDNSDLPSLEIDTTLEEPVQDGYLDINSNEEVYQDIPTAEITDPSLTVDDALLDEQYDEASLEDYQDISIDNSNLPSLEIDTTLEEPAQDGYIDINSADNTVNEDIYQDIPGTDVIDPSLNVDVAPVDGQYEEIQPEIPVEEYQDIPVENYDYSSLQPEVGVEEPVQDEYMDINPNENVLTEEAYQDISQTEVVAPSLTVDIAPVEKQYEEIQPEVPVEVSQDVPAQNDMVQEAQPEMVMEKPTQDGHADINLNENIVNEEVNQEEISQNVNNEEFQNDFINQNEQIETSNEQVVETAQEEIAKQPESPINNQEEEKTIEEPKNDNETKIQEQTNKEEIKEEPKKPAIYDQFGSDFNDNLSFSNSFDNSFQNFSSFNDFK